MANRAGVMTKPQLAASSLQPSAVITSCDGPGQRAAISVMVPEQTLGSVNQTRTPACEPAAGLGAHRNSRRASPHLGQERCPPLDLPQHVISPQLS